MISTFQAGNSLLDEDKRTFAGYVASTLDKLAMHIHEGQWRPEEIGGDVDIFIPRATGRIDTSYGALFRGPWHVVRKYVTTEVREFFEEYNNPRMTFSEWHGERIADRERERTRQMDYIDSAEYCLDELRSLRELQNRRDELILAARERGAGWRAIGENLGMSRAQLHNVASRYSERLAKAAPATYADDEPF